MQPPNYTVQQIAHMAGGRLFGDHDIVVLRLIFDSRLLYDCEGALYFALKGGHNDGHRYIEGLYQRGVRAFVVEQHFVVPKEMEDAAFIFVENPLVALQRVATVHRAACPVPLLAITGSNGKTIVKEWLGQVLSRHERIARSPRSYNSQIGVPLSVWQLNPEVSMGIFEAGISQPGEMQRLCEILKPTLGLITNIGNAHQENFLSIDEKLYEKLILFENVDLLFYNRDYSLIHTTISNQYPHKEVLTWGKHPDSNLRLLSVIENERCELVLKWKGDVFHVGLPFSDAISIENALPVILVMLFKGYGFDVIRPEIRDLQPVAMRMEQIEGINGSLVINDSYNSDFTSLEVALDFLEQQGKKKGCLRTLILSDMLQTGLDPADLYPRVADLVKSRHIDRLIGVGPELSKYASHFRSGDTFFLSTGELLAALHHFPFKNETVLIKGARAFEFEKVSDRLEQKQHSTLMEINLNALVHNLNAFKKRLKPETRILAMVKAFGYGSGSYEIAGALQHQKVDYLGVAYADEGMELRQAGITVPIMVMNPEIKSFAQMLQYNLEPEIYSFRVLKGFFEALSDHGGEGSGIHIKVDTGMFRLGFTADEVSGLITLLKQKSFLKVKSVFTHLVGSDDPVHDTFTHGQIGQFLEFTNTLEAGLGIKVWKHVLNSAGVERFSDAQYDMVRLGIGLYGINALPETRLHNVVTLKTYVSQVKKVKSGETVGYNRAGTMTHDGSVAVLPIGYADGLSRLLSNGKGVVLIKGELRPFIGNICMDMCMVDVSGLKVAEGDEVILFGDDHPVTDMAQRLNTIPYEILTSISRRVKRIYFRE